MLLVDKQQTTKLFENVPSPEGPLPFSTQAASGKRGKRFWAALVFKLGIDRPCWRTFGGEETWLTVLG